MPVYLEQNYPNPFNPSTAINFRLSATGQVKLDIFDLRGRLVRRLVKQELSAGPHVISWDGRDAAGSAVASGAYFYRLNANGQSYSRKMTLLK